MAMRVCLLSVVILTTISLVVAQSDFECISVIQLNDQKPPYTQQTQVISYAFPAQTQTVLNTVENFQCGVNNNVGLNMFFSQMANMTSLVCVNKTCTIVPTTGSGHSPSRHSRSAGGSHGTSANSQSSNSQSSSSPTSNSASNSNSGSGSGSNSGGGSSAASASSAPPVTTTHHGPSRSSSTKPVHTTDRPTSRAPQWSERAEAGKKHAGGKGHTQPTARRVPEAERYSDNLYTADIYDVTTMSRVNTFTMGNAYALNYLRVASDATSRLIWSYDLYYAPHSYQLWASTSAADVTPVAIVNQGDTTVISQWVAVTNGAAPAYLQIAAKEPNSDSYYELVGPATAITLSADMTSVEHTATIRGWTDLTAYDCYGAFMDATTGDASLLCVQGLRDEEAETSTPFKMYTFNMYTNSSLVEVGGADWNVTNTCGMNNVHSDGDYWYLMNSPPDGWYFYNIIRIATDGSSFESFGPYTNKDTSVQLNPLALRCQASGA